MNLKNMTKSAEGTVKDPGRNLKQKSGRNRPFLRVLTRIRGNPGIHTRKDVKKKVLRRVPFG